MQFYTGDWLKDPAVRACSLAARGLWTDLLCLMWESPERGVLKTGEQPWGAQEMASAVGADVTLVAKLLAELKGKGVASSRAEDGALYSRRMVRDEAERRKETERQRRYRGSGDRGSRTADAVTEDVTSSSRGSSSSASSSSANLTLNFTGAMEATGEPLDHGAGADARFDAPSGDASASASTARPGAGVTGGAAVSLEQLRLQAEILGRQERLLHAQAGGRPSRAWPAGGREVGSRRDAAAAASAVAGAAPRAAACGVRPKAAALERARLLEAEAEEQAS
jgi:hypothetical protein